MAEFLQKLRGLPKPKRVQLLWTLVAVTSLLISFGWLADINQTIVSARPPLLTQETSGGEQLGQTGSPEVAPVSLLASLKDFYKDIKELFTGTRTEIKVERQPEPDSSVPQPVELRKQPAPGGLPLE